MFCVLPLPLFASEWPQYRGPDRDGISSGQFETTWRKATREAVGGPLGARAAFLFEQRGQSLRARFSRRWGSEEQEFCIALNADTGQELWATPLGIADYPNGGVGSDDGPRSTPTVDGNRLVFSSYLKLACLDAATGAEIWSKDFVAEFGSTVIPWQNAASPASSAT